MSSNDIPLEAIINFITDELEKTPEKIEYKKTTYSWIKWLKKQKIRYKEKKITAYQYFTAVHGLAQFVQDSLDFSSKELDSILNYEYCQVCLKSLSEGDLEKKTCPSCRMPLSQLRGVSQKENIPVPNKRDSISGTIYQFQMFIFPKKIFNYLRYGIDTWIPFLILYTISSIILIIFTIITVPRFVYGNPVKQMEWVPLQNEIISDGIIGYLILNLILFLLYTTVIYLITYDAPLKIEYLQTLKIISVLIAPKVIFLPILALINQLSNYETYVLNYNVSFDQARFLIFNITDYAGTFGIILEFFSFVFIIIYLFLAIEYLWGFEREVGYLRIIPLIIMTLLLTFGFPIHL